MPQESFTTEKQKIEKEILKLQRKMRTLKTRQRRPVISSIVRSMLDYDISLEELSEAYNKRSNNEAKATSSPKAALPPRFRNSETGDTWTGRGRPPRWIVDAEAKGNSRDSFLIEK
ncbi:H-NS histone family protein [Paenalcaligenes niemegkensis]|uniref:H-NS histone family protein n=1 Tax=Paenalcaligenes niemegkensis TaxID=2895469 RepID=UPI001EE8E87B|nr:H-NS histone family protein [Paenalcaligenes niemegkensis]MCQ9616825.1 H-NS histone family protein [Paenalcaligenes niemegkensis]